MDTALFQNILFATLSLFLVVLTVGVVASFIFFISALKSITAFFKMLQDEGHKIVNDIEKLREAARHEGAKFASMAMSVISFFTQARRSKKK